MGICAKENEAPAWGDNDRGACRLGWVRQEGRQRWRIHVDNPLAGAGAEHGLLLFPLFGAGRDAGPKINDFFRRCGRRHLHAAVVVFFARLLK